MRNLFTILGFITAILCSQVVVGEAICSSGKFYNLTTQSCQICPVGTFTNGTVSLSQCEPCPAGSRTYSTGSSQCDLCQAGTYEVNRTSCSSCPKGTYSNAGAKNISECITCPAGSHAYSEGSKECDICSAGYYEVNRTNCYSCPKGTYSNAGAKDVSECIACPAGSHAYSEGSKECEVCRAGTYEVNRTSCYSCPKGTYSKEGSKDISECIACPAGYYAYDTGSSKCEICRGGTYEVNRTSCYSCPAGTASLEGSKDSSDCIACPAGYHAYDGGSEKCTICKAGTYEVNRTRCYSCPPGTYSKEGSKDISECITCPAGFWTDYYGAQDCSICRAGTYEVNRTSCISCPKGTYSKKEGSKDISECMACSAGFVADYSGAQECSICPAGTYEADNRTSCNYCPAGTTSLPGVSGPSGCTQCAPGYHTYGRGSKECEKCSPGSYEVNRTSCVKCPTGTFEVNSTQCMACPNGTISLVGSSSCSDCPAGTVSVKNGTECRNPAQVEKEEEIPTKNNNKVMFYVLGIALVAIVVFAVGYKCSKKPVADVENDKEIKISLVPQGANQLDNAANYYH